MISKIAVLYDLHEALEQISRGYAADADRKIRRLVERLDYVLTPYEQGNTASIRVLELRRAED